MRAEEPAWAALSRTVRQARDALRAGPQGPLGDMARSLSAVTTRVEALELSVATQRICAPPAPPVDLGPAVADLGAGLEGAWAALEAHTAHLAALQAAVEQLLVGMEEVRAAYGPQLADLTTWLSSTAQIVATMDPAPRRRRTGRKRGEL